MTLTTRAGKGAPISAAEHDENLNHVMGRVNHTGAQAISTVTGLQTALDDKASTSHTHTLSELDDLPTDTIRLNNYTASALPTVNDDTGDGYEVGSRWIVTSGADAGREFVCDDASAAAAVWTESLRGDGTSVAEATYAASDGILFVDKTDDTVKEDVGNTFATNVAVDNVQSGSTYTLVLADRYQEIRLTNATACTLTIPPNASVAFPVGTRIPIWGDGAGTYTIAAGTNVTLNGTVEGSGTLQTQYQGAVARKVALPDTWIVSGDFVMGS